MDDKTQKERLEQELRFLKESFEAEVISKEEFEKGKDRIEKKLKEIQKTAKEQESLEKEEIKAEKVEEVKTEEKIKLKVIQDEPIEHEHFEDTQKKIDDEETAPETPKTEIEEQKKEGRFFKYGVVFVVLLIVVFVSYSLLKPDASKPQEKINQVEFAAACSSNDDCKQEGKEGICVNPGAKDAKCEFKDAAKTNVIVLNDRINCFNCDTERVLDILENWFGTLKTEEIDYNTIKGKSLAERFDAKALPMYILDENITKRASYGQFKQIFIKKDSSYILNEDASASTFYFKRDNVADKLDLFVIAGDDASIRAEKNLQEFLDAFEEAEFEKHTSGDKLAKELGIKNFPTFLINNRIKFSGVHSAETIKENFCRLNKLTECEKSLSKSLI